ncbi:3-(3-hydroxyphenyl)propionate hydroxylase [Nonomuraea sp. NN258]|uniref:FAD-dependent monooxygenase n=1 Tax=Nonomuraea antri TaxID=2730852 RepID=UPI0015682E1D|nr:FAD-dependent monooxygenase [Nonomuraea antri]NRQ36521.1 3-(3-hydroxyphenyl)propionate hydroxylase [Nonomuraea antri]
MIEYYNVVECDVLVVGAGPTGLTLSAELARRGIRHQLIERAPEPQTGSRGKGLQPRSLEILRDLGVVDEILATGTVGMPLRLFRDHRQIAELPTASGGPRPGVPYPDLVVLPQWRVERILRDRLHTLGLDVRFGAELLAAEQDGTGVTATVRQGQAEQVVRAGYLVGCDGGHSTVRKLLGARLIGHTREQSLYVGDVRIAGLPDDAAYTWFGRDGSYLAVAPLPHSGGAWQLQATPEPGSPSVLPAPTLGTFQRLFAERSGRTGVRLSEASWLSSFRFNTRMVDSYRHGRIFLAGDAAHVHTPAGAQGMNTGIQDAYNLGWKLAAALGGASEALLDSYTAERRPVAAKVLAGSTRGAEVLLGLHPFLRDHVVFPLLEQPAIMRRLLARTSELDIAYPASPLTLRAEDRRRPRPGERAPDAYGPGGRLFDIMRGTHWTLLGFGARTTAALRAAEAAHPGVTSHVVTDHRHQARRLYHARPGTLVLIRPDGYIATRTLRPQTVMDHLSRLGV